jgi:hypothetical protein
MILEAIAMLRGEEKKKEEEKGRGRGRGRRKRKKRLKPVSRSWMVDLKFLS